MKSVNEATAVQCSAMARQLVLFIFKFVVIGYLLCGRDELFRDQHNLLLAVDVNDVRVGVWLAAVIRVASNVAL